ncbi:hypothetical protein NC653_028445 [Populus alba x Populus x berolinensis]|uniref:Uncharacterized protein n=1 Tax=Populus alba x Populus x berolinensis TaxID=444605 RepID=A0AAD6M816_9ROSI|nr:hypothetical protein NC653_028445 [Populus alba x Populus x berolinensis]
MLKTKKIKIFQGDDSSTGRYSLWRSGLLVTVTKNTAQEERENNSIRCFPLKTLQYQIPHICQTQTKSHGLDHPTPLPNFSIKKIMYFKARSKDIKNSWPFFSKKSCNFV